MSRVIYDWNASRRINDFKLEGRGELQAPDDGSLQVRTYDCGPLKRATNVWLHKLPLPRAFEVEWEFKSNSANGNTMIIFNATPLGLKNLFEDSRADALYCDLAGYGKLVAHTCGFHRSPYGKPSVLRKIGGHVPAHFGAMTWPDPPEFEEQSTLSSVTEPVPIQEKGKPQKFKLVRTESTIDFFVNRTQVHKWTDKGQYPHFKEPIHGGLMGFRNFTGFADDFYSSIIVREL